MSKLDAICRCGSGKQTFDCCYQESPPVSRPELRVNSISFRSKGQIIDGAGRAMSSQFPVSMSGQFNLSDLVVTEDMIYLIFKTAFADIAQRLPPFKSHKTDEQLNKVLEERTLLENLHRNAKAVRYHQQSFIFRYEKIKTEFRQQPVIISGNEITLTDEDNPLEMEFEAFMIRYRTAIELLFKLVSFKLLNNPYSAKLDMGKVIKTLRKRTRDDKSVQFVALLDDYNDWLKEQRLIRNQIVHDGELSILAAFEHAHNVTFNATILKKTADYMCFDLFKTLVNFLTDGMNILYPVAPTDTRNS